jgi:hypothetical protein
LQHGKILRNSTTYTKHLFVVSGTYTLRIALLSASSLCPTATEVFLESLLFTASGVRGCKRVLHKQSKTMTWTYHFFTLFASVITPAMLE